MDIKNLIHVSLLLLVSLQYLPIIMVSILFLVHLFAFSVILRYYCEQIKKSISINIRIYRQHVQADAEQEVNTKLCNSVRMGAFPVGGRCFYRKPLRKSRILK